MGLPQTDLFHPVPLSFNGSFQLLSPVNQTAFAAPCHCLSPSVASLGASVAAALLLHAAVLGSWTQCCVQ